MRKEVFSVNGAEITGYLHVEEGSWICTSHNRQKLTWVTHLNIRTKTIKSLEENIRIDLCDLC